MNMALLFTRRMADVVSPSKVLLLSQQNNMQEFLLWFISD